jgi:hypothetical protein
LVSSAGSPAGEGITLPILSSVFPALSAADMTARMGSNAAKQRLAVTAKDVKTVISRRNSLFPIKRLILLLY